MKRENVFLNLYDVAGITMIATILTFLFWCLPGNTMPFTEVILVFIVFVAACYFAKRGESQ